MSDRGAISPFSRSAEWPCDFGESEHTYQNDAGRVVRARWKRCIGTCGAKWFWSEDVTKNRMCRFCSPPVNGQEHEGDRQEVASQLPPPLPRPATPCFVPPSRHVLAEGKEYRSIYAAARALGIGAGSIKGRIRRGTPGYRYLD